MGKTLRQNSKYPVSDQTRHESQHAKTMLLANHKHQDPTNQGGVHVADTHVKGKRLQRTWPKMSESHQGRRKV